MKVYLLKKWNEMKKAITLIAIIFFSTLSFAQNGAMIEFKNSDNTIDYGIIKKGVDTGIREFEFVNTGDAPLIITSVQSTAGCTILTKSFDTVLPGKAGIIQVKYNMNLGPIRKTITVESNAINYESGRIPLKIKGEVIAN